MEFVKRDFVLLAATVFVVFGMWVYLELAYAIGIGIALFFGLKMLAVRQQKSLSKKIGEGFCAECGEQIIEKKCPNCDSKTK